MRWVVSAVVVVFFLFFALRNQYPVEVDFFITRRPTSLIFVMLVTFLIGLLVGAGAMFSESLKWFRLAKEQSPTLTGPPLRDGSSEKTIQPALPAEAAAPAEPEEAV